MELALEGWNGLATDTENVWRDCEAQPDHLHEHQGTVESHWDANLESLIHPHFAAQIVRRLIKRSSDRSQPYNGVIHVRNADDVDQAAVAARRIRISSEVTQ